MDDLISRQAAIDALSTITMYKGSIPFDTAVMRIEQLPSAQPDIIRCRDCRYYQDNNNGYPHMNCKWDANETPDEDDFCSGAEMRTDE